VEPREHAEQRGAIGSFLRRIPGFGGYLEKEYRRESDAMTRRWLADRLQRSKRGIDELARPLADAGRIELLPQLDRFRGRLDKLIGRIRGAMHGYSGFFDLVQIDEARLEAVYEHDLRLMDNAEALGQAVEGLPARRDQLDAALPELTSQIDALERQWDLRDSILKGWEEPHSKEPCHGN